MKTQNIYYIIEIKYSSGNYWRFFTVKLRKKNADDFVKEANRKGKQRGEQYRFSKFKRTE